MLYLSFEHGFEVRSRGMQVRFWRIVVKQESRAIAILISACSSNKGTIQRRKQRGVADAVPKLRTKAKPTSSVPKISPSSLGVGG